MNKQAARITVMLICAFILFSSFAPVIATSGYRESGVRISNKDAYVATLPYSLKMIGNEAFCGSSISVVYFNEELVHIGENAFLNAYQLTDVYIPKKTVHIEANAFPERVSIHGIEGSYAQKWAVENGYEFTIDDVWNTRAEAEGLHIEQLLFVLCAIIPFGVRGLDKSCKRSKVFLKSMRPQDRPELYPVDYRFP